MLRALLLATAFAAAALVTPGAIAQAPAHTQTTLQLEIDPFDAPVTPKLGQGVTTLKIRYSYFAPAGVAALSATQVDLMVAEAPAWAEVLLSPSTLHVPVGAPSGFAVYAEAPAQAVELTISVTEDAPAFLPGSLVLRAIAHPNGMLAPSEAEAQTVVQAAYAGYVDVAGVPSVARVERGGDVSFPVTITNHANGATKVKASLERPIAGLSVSGLLPVMLESRQSGGERTSHSTIVTLSADDDFDGAVAVVTIVGHYALNDAIALEPMTLRIPIEAVGDAKRSIFASPDDASDGSLVEAQSSRTASGPASLPITLAIAGALAGAWIGTRKWKSGRGA